MTPRGTIPGMVRFGDGFRNRGGIEVTIETDVDTLPDKGRRPQGDVVKGPHGEQLNTRRERFEIQIQDGGDGGKYTWKRIHPTPDGDSDNADGGGGSDFDGGMPAYEINGREDVAVGLNFMAERSEVGPWVNFSAGGEGGEIVRWVKPTASAPNSYGNWPGVVRKGLDDNTYTDGDPIRLTFDDVPAVATGERLFVGGETELGTLRGSVRETDTGSARSASDGVTTLNSKVVTSATAAFIDADVGALITGTGIPAGATIVSVESATSATISVNATAAGTVSITITPSTLYPLYHARAHKQLTVTVCIDGSPVDQCWKIPGWVVASSSCTSLSGSMQFNRAANSQYTVAPSPMRI